MNEDVVWDVLATVGNFAVIFLFTAISISTGFGFDFVRENPYRVVWTCSTTGFATALGWLKTQRGLGDVNAEDFT